MEDQEEPQARRIFLARTLRAPVPATGVVAINSLECKVSCQHSKVSYVLDTEDVLVASHGRRLRGDQAARAWAGADAKFRSWVEARLAADVMAA